MRFRYPRAFDDRFFVHGRWVHLQGLVLRAWALWRVHGPTGCHSAAFGGGDDVGRVTSESLRKGQEGFSFLTAY